MAKTLISNGASWLHLIDLDGAKNPKQNQIELIMRLINQNNNISIQTGGGIRTKSHIKKLIHQGAVRIIIGSQAVTNKNEVAKWFNYFGPERLVLALDVIFKDNTKPMIAINGWQKISEYTLYDVIEFYKSLGLIHLLCTNIALDGTLHGPDYALYKELLEKYPFLKLQASGGIQSLSDINTLREMQLSGVIIGRALYEKKFTLSEALTC
jgi:phosphoribosylformimino-5-aminoimidazole carboxamide ribotide isomerase